MEKQISIAQHIYKLMIQKGIDRRKHASTMAEILGIKYNSAKQKLDEKRGITFNEVKEVFRYFNEQFIGGRDYNCVFIFKDDHKRCNIETEDKPSEIIEKNEKYAVKQNGLFIIDANRENNTNHSLYKVKKLEFLPSPKLAILDNENDILELIESITTRYGIDTYTFKTKKDIINSIKSKEYDCYILDWLLDFGETSEEVIQTIRDKNDKNIPILVLTGQINQYETTIGEAIVKYGVELIEKPARSIIITSILLSNLFFQD